MKKTIVYIDGFNLHYGALRGTPYKWLDLQKLCQLLLPRNQVVKIKYFTARVKAIPDDPDAPTRQQVYLRALATFPNIEIVFGHFLRNNVWMPLTGCSPGQQKYAEVIKTEEKGSDVNLACHLLLDGFRGNYEVAAVGSYDSDLVEPVRIVCHDLNKIVGIINPHKGRASRPLSTCANFTKSIRETALAKSQLPTRIKDSVGTFQKPAAW